MSSEDGTYTFHYDEWLPFAFIVPEPGAKVDLLRIDGPVTTLAYAATWPSPGEWQFWRRRG